jgi:4-hydroxy-L-threonine phosphate dehydrogenase PdxA
MKKFKLRSSDISIIENIITTIHDSFSIPIKTSEFDRNLNVLKVIEYAVWSDVRSTVIKIHAKSNKKV